MAKQIDSLLLESTTTKTVKSAESKVEKTGTSLFDSLLKENFKSNESIESKESTNQQVNQIKTSENISKTINKNSTTNIEVKAQLNTLNTQQEVDTQVSQATEKVEVKPSLLDKLISEAKKDLNNQPVKEEVNKTNTNNSIEKQTLVKTVDATNSKLQTTQDTQVELKQTAKTQTPNKSEDSSVKLNKDNDSLLDDSKTPTKNQGEPSLLDKLVSEAKVDVEVSKTSKEIQTPQKIENNQEVKQSGLNDTNVNKTQEILASTVIVKPQIKNTDNAQTVTTAQTKEESVEVENKEIKPQIKNTDNAQTVTTAQTKEESVEVENKEIKPQTVTSIQTKQTTSLDSVEPKDKQAEILNNNALTNNDKINQEVAPVISQQASTEKVSVQQQSVLTQTAENKNISTITADNSKTQETQVSKEVKVVPQNTTVNSDDVNKKVAKELASLNTNTESSDINISKEKLLLEENKSVDKKSTSLMDQLLQKNKEVVFGNEVTGQQKQMKQSDFLTSIYLGNQKNSISNQSLLNKTQAVNIAVNGSTVEDVKTSAQMLELGLEDVDVQKAVENIKRLDIEKLDRTNLLDRLAFNKNIANIDIRNMITSSVEASKALLEDTINLVDDLSLNVNSQAIQSIQTRIVGARQQMTQMMSDVARQMYENYKPPVTAFRINLNPATLGAISILMKNDRDNALSISMSVSSSSTLDSLLDNQSTLRNSLNKLFDENTKFNLNFSSSSDNNQSSNQNNKDGNSQQQFTNQEVLNTLEENEVEEEKNTDYM